MQLSPSVLSNGSDLSLEEKLEDSNESYTYGLEVKIPFTIASTLFLVLSATVFFAMRRTKNIPQMARFLGLSLVVFYALIILLLAIRKFQTDWHVQIVIMVIIFGIRHTATVTVALMSVERFVLFRFPYFYIRHVWKAKVKCVVATLWLLCFASFSTNVYMSCHDECGGDNSTCVRECASACFIGFTVPVFTVVAMLTIICYVYIIAKIAKYKLQEYRRHYKTTVVLFINAVNFICYAIVLLVESLMKPEFGEENFIFDIFVLLTGSLDTAIYVLWFRECRLELLKMIAWIHPKLQVKADKIRVDVFQIQLKQIEPQANCTVYST